VPKEKAEPAVVTPWAPPGWWQYVKDAIEAIKQEGGGAFENLKGAEGRKPKSATPAKDASKPTVMDAVVSYVPERLTGLNFDMQALAAPGLGPKVRAKECECEKPKKRRKPGCTNKVISRVTRDGIRTTKTRITCPPSKLKSLSR
jgi:hypothetical protein